LNTSRAGAIVASTSNAATFSAHNHGGNVAHIADQVAKDEKARADSRKGSTPASRCSPPNGLVEEERWRAVILWCSADRSVLTVAERLSDPDGRLGRLRVVSPRQLEGQMPVGKDSPPCPAGSC
jgi:hypothetical protein